MVKKKKKNLNLAYLFERDSKTEIPRLIWYAVKFCIYACLGMVNELIFTDVMRLINSWNNSFANRIFGDFLKMTFPGGVPTMNEQLGWTPKYMFSMTSFWLFFVYGTGLLLIELTYNYFKKHTRLCDSTKKDGRTELPSYVRQAKAFSRRIIYTAIIFLVEFSFGWIYKFLFHEFIWEYSKPLFTTSFAIIPSWFFTSWIAEHIVKKFSESDLEKAFLTDEDFDRVQEIYKNKKNSDIRINLVKKIRGKS